MKQNFILFFLVSALVGCGSSGGTKNSDDLDSPAIDGDAPESSDSAPARNSKAPSRGEEPSEAKVQTQPTSNTDAQNLMEALKMGNDDSIEKAATQILGKNPSDARALNAIGYIHYKKAHYPAALMMFNKALKADPNSSEAHNNLGLTYLAQKEHREAVKQFRKALEVNPVDATAAANLGSIYIENKDYIKALVTLEIAYRKYNKDQKVLNNYGIALTANGKYNEAQGIYKQALGVNSNNKDVMFNYAILLIEFLKKHDEGLELLNKVKFLGPSPEARNRINLLENKAKAGLK